MSTKKLQIIGGLGQQTDAIPTEGSTNPVQSGGVYDAIAAQSAALSDLIDDKIENAIGEGGGVSSWNDLTDKPVVMQGGDTLTWDGNTEGLVCVEDMMLYKVSDIVPTMDDLANGCQLFDSVSNESWDGEFSMFENGVIELHPLAAYVAPIDGVTTVAWDSTITFPEKGIYFANTGTDLFGYISSLTIPNYTGFVQEKIAPSYLYQPDFSQNDTSAPDYIKNRTHWAEEPVTTTEVVLEETTFEFSDGMCQATVAPNLVDGAECVVTWDGVEYVSICKEIRDGDMIGLMLGNPAILQNEENPIDNGQPFGFAYVPSYGITMMLSTDTTATSHAVKIVSTVTTQEIHKLDNKYLDIGVDDINGAEWIAHSEHKTNILISEPVTITVTEEVTELTINAVTEDEILYSTSMIVVWNGTEYTVNSTIKGLFGNLDLFIEGIGFGTEFPFLFVFEGGTSVGVKAVKAGEVTIDSIILKSNMPVKMPNKFLDINEWIDANSDKPVTSSAIYQELRLKQNNITGAASTITSANLTADKALISDADGKVAASEVTSEELEFLSGVTSNVQAQLLAKHPSALKWNGVIGDKEFILLQSDNGMNMGLVRVADIPDAYELFLAMSAASSELMCTAGMFGGGEVEGAMTSYATLPLQIEDDGLAIVGEVFVIIPRDNYLFMDALNIPKKGVYTMCMTMTYGSYSIPMIYGSELFIPSFSFENDNGGGSRYFEEVTKVTESSDKLTWDGNTTGLQNYNNIIFKISDSIPTVEDLSNGGSITVTKSDGTKIESIFTSEDINSDSQQGITMIIGGIYVFAKPVLGFTGLAFAKEGDSYISSFTINNYEFIISSKKETVIKTEHLPEALRFGEIETPTGGDTLTWDGGTTGKEMIAVDGIDGLYMVHISDAVVNETDFVNGFTVTKADGDIFHNGDTVDGALIESKVNDEGFVSIVVDILPVFLFIPTDVTIDGVSYYKGVYILFSTEYGVYFNSLTIDGYKGFPTTELVKIDPKYLPEGIGGGSGLPETTTEDEGKILRIVNGAPSWAAIANAEEVSF